MRLRTRILFIAALALAAVPLVCLGDASPSPLPPGSVLTSSGQTVLQSLYDWVMSHQIVLGMLIAGVLDFLFALNPSWASNGILHFLYLWARKKAGLPDPVSTS